MKKTVIMALLTLTALNSFAVNSVKLDSASSLDLSSSCWDSIAIESVTTSRLLKNT